VVALTAGILANDIPALTAEQEREAFERGVAEEVAEEGMEPPDVPSCLLRVFASPR
jgi:hypothetical protein